MLGGGTAIAAARAEVALQQWFAAQCGGLTGERLDRVARAERDLLRCVEERSELVLPPGDRRLLALERNVGPEGAVARPAPAAQLGRTTALVATRRRTAVDPVR